MWIADSYAKFELGLNILDRLPGGKLNLESGLCFLDWRDRFEVTESDKMKVVINNEDQSDESKRIIKKAIGSLKRYVGLKGNYYFNIEKRIPSGAGLGSRGSNASLTLKILNKIEELGLTGKELADLSRDINDEIAFFLNEQTGIYRRDSQQIKPLNIQPDVWIVTCYPKGKEEPAYGQPPVTVNRDPDYSLQHILTEEDPYEWQYMLSNDLEQSVFQQNPLPGNLKDQFYEFGAVYASMTGGGPAVYGLFEQNFVAVDAYKTLLNLGHPANLTKPGFTPDFGIYRKE